MYLHVARRYHVLAVGEELNPPLVAGDAEDFVRLAPLEERRLAVPLRQAGGQRAAGVVLDQFLYAGQPAIIVGMQIDAEHAGSEHAISHLERSQFHVAVEVVDGDLPVDTGRLLRLSALRHPGHLVQNVTIDAATGPTGFAGFPAAALSIDRPRRNPAAPIKLF